MKLFIAIVTFTFIFSGCNNSDEFICHLTGKVVNRESRVLILKKQVDSPENSEKRIFIDSLGNFEYDLKYKYIEAYELVFEDEYKRGLWDPVTFFPDGDTLKFVLYPVSQKGNDKITGSKLSLKEKELTKRFEEDYYDEYMFWYTKKDSLSNINMSLSEYGLFVSNKIDSIYDEAELSVYGKPVDELNIYDYSRFLTLLNIERDRKHIPVDTLKHILNRFKQRFPGHPYNEIAGYRVNGLENIKVGGRFVDFVAPDSSGTNHRISDVVFTKQLTLIDLWSPWCVPCIRKSKNLLPLYEELNKFGFEVIGVIGGINDRKQYLDALRKYNYPWLVLSEIKNKNNIWEKYNISKSGGKQFLVDNNGKIVAVNPTVQDIKRIMNE